MKFCVKCGEPLEKGASVCKNCGAKVKIKSASSTALDLDEKTLAETVEKKTVKAKIAFAFGIVFFIAFLMAGLRMIWEPTKATVFKEMTAYAFNIWWAIAIVSCIVANILSESAMSTLQRKQVLSGKTLGLAKASRAMSGIAAALCVLWLVLICFLGATWVLRAIFDELLLMG